MAKQSATGVLVATKSIVLLRVLVYAAMTLITLIFWGLMLLLSYALGSAGAIVILIAAAATFGFFQLAKRYVLYLIRAGHVYAMTRFLKNGELPGGGAYPYCQRVVTDNFATVNVGALMDALIEGAVRQIMRWLNRAENLLRFIPGSSALFNVVNMILSTAGNYIDEAVLSLVFMREHEPNKWKTAADGVVLYAQSWKGMLKGAAKVVAMVWGLRAAAFIVFALIGSIWGSAFAVILGLAMAWFADGALVNPFATAIMIEQYHASIEGVQPAMDLYEKLSGVSSKFRQLWDKASSPQTPPEQGEIPAQ